MSKLCYVLLMNSANIRTHNKNNNEKKLSCIAPKSLDAHE